MSLEAEREMWDAIATSDRRRSGKPDRVIVNRRPGPCRYCGHEVAAGSGLAELHGRSWSVRHRDAAWSGSPVSGSWVGGCPA